MIDSILLQTLRNGVYLQFLTDILTIVLKNNPDNLQARTAYGALRSATDDTEKLFKLSQGSPITEEITALDLRRDRAISGIAALANGFGFSSDAVVGQHAKTLSDHLALFGTAIAGDNYQSETASIRNIVNDYNTKPALQQALTALQMDSWKTELEASNNAFNDAYIARSEELGGASPDNLKAKRTLANAAYYKLRDTINAHFTLTDGSEPYATVTQTINALVAQYNVLANGRGGTTPDTPVVAASV